MGKYIKYYDTHLEYDEEKDLFDLPNVSWCELEEDVHYTDEDFYRKLYLTFDIVSDGTLIWKKVGNETPKSIYYSVNNGTTWTQISPSNNAFLNVTLGLKVLFKGNNSSYYFYFDSREYASHRFNGTAFFNAYGNIMSLIGGDDFLNITSFNYNPYYDRGFGYLFSESKIINAKNLILPVTTLASYCYTYMFAGCTSLITAPVLPATTLTTSCYSYMFLNCSSLNYIKALFTTTPSTTSTNYWVNGVASSGTFVKNPLATWTTTGVHGIPSGWTVVTADN